MVIYIFCPHPPKHGGLPTSSHRRFGCLGVGGSLGVGTGGDPEQARGPREAFPRSAEVFRTSGTTAGRGGATWLGSSASRPVQTANISTTLADACLNQRRRLGCLVWSCEHVGKVRVCTRQPVG